MTKKPAAKKPRKRIKARSDSLRARALRELYEEAKKTFLDTKRHCERCGGLFKPLELHHSCGRAGTLLIDRRFFNALCSRCHNTVHLKVKEAQHDGWMADTGAWNTPPLDTETVRLNGLILDRINAIGERIKKKTQAKITKEWEARVRKAAKK